MKKVVLLSLSLALLLFSCKKDEKLDVTLNQAGFLTVTVSNVDGTPVTDETVFLNLYSEQIESKKTDENGRVVFGGLLLGNYVLTMDDYKLGGKTFNVSQPIQIRPGQETNTNLIPEDFVGTITFKARENAYDADSNKITAPLAGINAIVVSDEDHSYYGASLEKLKEVAIVSGKTGSDGTVVMEGVPSNTYVKVIYYENEKDWKTSSSMYMVEKDKNEDVKAYFYYSRVTVTFTDYSYDPLQGVTAFLVSYEDYIENSDDVVALQQAAVYSTTSNSLGNAVFSKVAYGEYRLVYYNGDISDWDSTEIWVNDDEEERNIYIY